MDSIVSVYSDTRTEYTKQLCIFLIPAYFQFFVDLLAKAKQGSESKKVLWQFQTYLNEIHDWNMEKVHNEINTIHVNTGCDYLEDLLTAVFIAHTKVLTAIRLSANNKKVEITIPKVEHFLFKVLCEISKLLWSSTYLFREDISGVDRQQNYKAIEGIISEGILQAVRSLVPVKSILKNLVNNDAKDTKDAKEADDDSDDDVSINKLDSADSKPASSDPVEKLVEKPVEEPKEPLEEPLAEHLEEPLAHLEEHITESEPNELLSTVKSAFNTIASSLPLVELNESPQIINLDEKPSVSFAKYNTLFSSEDPEESKMIDADSSNSSPDLEILDTAGVSLSVDDCDQLDDIESSPLDDYEEL
jgi:hypothetical protein